MKTCKSLPPRAPRKNNFPTSKAHTIKKILVPYFPSHKHQNPPPHQKKMMIDDIDAYHTYFDTFVFGGKTRGKKKGGGGYFLGGGWAIPSSPRET